LRILAGWDVFEHVDEIPRSLTAALHEMSPGAPPVRRIHANPIRRTDMSSITPWVKPAASLRAAMEADVPRLAELVEAAYGHYVDRLGGLPGPMTEDYADIVRRFLVTVAEQNDEIIGLIVLGVGDEGFLVYNVAVDPSHQGQGIGRALLEHAELTARRAGFDSIYLYTHENMTENLALYSRIGYVEFDRRLAGEAGLVYLRKQLADGESRALPTSALA
jgi:ribosomal protein S18 acetylase RimI-like enzyme